METYNNPVLERLPVHLQQYVVPQSYDRYTPVDQAIWRYVMRQNYSYLKDVAYYPYIPGLIKAGLSIEKIPHLQEMNDSLCQIGWGAVTVDGFIPPSAFMEFQAHRVLVIAADIRQLEHIEYTPAPDIIHESSGHAPIIGEPEYAAYLQYFGEVGSKAMFSSKDFELYEAIRQLSILKEQKDASKEIIQEAEALLKHIQENMGEPSEMALLSRLHWWTVEYGLIGTVDNPKIYGAGLLSSIGESVSCMRDEVPKIHYSLDTLNYPYDITTAQPQLFVTPDFKHVRQVLDQFAERMAFRRGGTESLDKAIECANVCTAVYSSGLEVSGIFQSVDEPIHSSYIKTKGPTALSYAGKQLAGHRTSYHRDGFGSPVGRLQDQTKSLEDYSDEELAAASIQIGKYKLMRFESGIEVTGVIRNIIRHEGKVILISFEPCQVIHRQTNTFHFRKQWGIYDMGIGESIISVYSGASDKEAYEQQSNISPFKTTCPEPTEETAYLHHIHAQIRQIRTAANDDIAINQLLADIDIKREDTWLALVELAEIAFKRQDKELASLIEKRLCKLKSRYPDLEKLINDGLRLAKDSDIDLVLSQ